MNIFESVLFAGVVGLMFAVFCFVVTAILLFLIPSHWHRLIQWPLIILAGLGIVVFTIFITVGIVTFSYDILPPPPPPHACGGPYVPNAAPCEATLRAEWGRETDLVEKRLIGWVLIPPGLRPSCDWVTTSFCAMTKQNPHMIWWDEYIVLILSIVGAGLLGVMPIDWLFRRSIRRQAKVGEQTPYAVALPKLNT